MKPIVLVNIPADDALRRRMRAAAPEMEFVFIAPGEACDRLKEACILFGQFRPDVFQEAKALKWLQILSSGVDGFMLPGVLPEGVTLTSATGCYGDVISEFMLANTLSLLYRLPQYRDRQSAGQWGFADYPSMIKGSAALILGLGDIGQGYARRMKALGAHTIGVRRANRQKPAYMDELYTFDDPGLDALFPRAQIIAMCMPGTPQTTNMLSAKRIRSLKREAIVINVGRGSAIDERALAAALKEGRIRGAALDVFEKEPLPSSSPLWALEALIVTPHIAGLDFAPAVLAQATELFLRNLAAYRANKPLENTIDRNTHYAKKLNSEPL